MANQQRLNRILINCLKLSKTHAAFLNVAAGYFHSTRYCVLGLTQLSTLGCTDISSTTLCPEKK